MEKGLVHIYTGDGKGKTTSATGLAVRCASYGKKVIMYQFLKATPSGELCACKKLDIKVIRPVDTESFWFDMSDAEKLRTKTQIRNALEHIFDEACSMLVLDEVICLADLGIITAEELISLIKSKPSNTELILTGRGMPQELADYADYISEIKCVKHPYQKNISAREGIEY